MLRQYLDLLKRHRWLILQAVVVTAVVAGLVAASRPNVYEATARVLLRPNDPNEQLSNKPVAADNLPDRYVSAQTDIVRSMNVATAAAVLLKAPQADTRALLGKIAARQITGTNIVRISAQDATPARAQAIANAFTTAYIENRRQFAISGIDTAVTEIEGKLTDLQTRISALDAAIGGGTASPGIPATAEARKAARDGASVQYESLYSTQQNLVVERTLKRGQAELIAEATLPGAPVSPKPLRDGALGGVVGLLIGLGLGYAREQLGDKPQSRDDVEQLTNSRVIAELPLEPEASEHPESLSMISRPRGLLAEAVRSLRSSIDFLETDAPARTIVVTSAVPGDGKSLVSANLAAAYALSGRRTVLVMADLRRPRLSSDLPPDERKGLSELVAGAPVELEEQLLRTAIPNLFLLPPGPLPPNPAELLASARAGEILQELADLVDVVIIDTPPLLAVTDGAVLANRADAVLLVAAVDSTTRLAMRRSYEVLASTGTKVLGIVLNKVEAKATQYYSYGYAEMPKKRRRTRALAPSAVDGGSADPGATNGAHGANGATPRHLPERVAMMPTAH
jgi:capsular exopolysaccharide synthesis family protein